MGKSELRNYEVFCTTHSRIIQALSLEHAMSKFKDIDDGKIIGAWDSEYYNATESLSVIDNTVSHSPTEPEFDTLQEGDFVVGKNHDYEKILSLYTKRNGPEIRKMMAFAENGLVYTSEIILTRMPNNDLLPYIGKTQLTPEEFLRRAENTF